ncbi:hypothetical protein NQ318_018617 [Aromia moschata]|uniref:Uncharacterized protein n=1 Tax=Aromia moschata TaxID=1265417 RepID=A0AAV8ZIJ2_9CUCU|nr:hypothetical protein NQ318_018617 [Aromia moschata]
MIQREIQKSPFGEHLVVLDTETGQLVSKPELPNIACERDLSRYIMWIKDRSCFILDLLECYQEWTKKQSIFWKWMVTTVAEREKTH